MAAMTSLLSIVPSLLSSYLSTSGSPVAASAVTVTVESPTTAWSFPLESIRVPEKV